MQRRRRFIQTRTLEDRLAERAERLQEEAELLPPGAKRDAAMRCVHQAETGLRVSEWLCQPSTRSPE